MRKIVSVCALILAVCLLCSACGARAVTAAGFALNTVVSVSLYDGDETAAAGALTLCSQWERKLSRTVAESEISALNAAAGAPVTLSAETAELLALAQKYEALSGGRFDVTVAPLSDLWDFNGDPRVPAEEELAAARSRVGAEKLRLDGRTASLSGGAQVDLGAIAKGYIADRLTEALRAQGKTRGIVNLGGNVAVFGGGDAPFTVAVQKPFGQSGEYACTLSISDGAVVTSGVYERGFEADGVWYHHLLDPRTGCPAQTGLWSVTVIAASAADADALATVLFLLGEAEGVALAERLPDVEAVFIRDGGSVRFTSGLADGQGRAKVIS